MKTKKLVIAGKAYEVPCNNSNEISDSETKLSDVVIKYIKAAPRLERSSNGKPRIKDDAGNIITIGCKTCCQDGETLVDRKGAVSAPEGFWLAVSQALEAKKDAPQEFKDFAKAQLSSSISVEELIKKVSLEDLLSLMK